MTDIVETDGIRFEDEEVHSLANEVLSTIHFTDGAAGSRYTTRIIDTINFTERVRAGGEESVASSINFTGEGDVDRREEEAASLALSDHVTGTKRSTITLIDTINFSESLETPTVARCVSTVNFTGAATFKRTLALSSSIALTGAPSALQRHSSISLSSSLGLTSSELQSAASQEVGETLNLTGAAIGTRQATNEEASSIALTGAASGPGRKEETPESIIAFADLVLCTLHATQSVVDEIDFTDRVRTSSDTLSNFWSNGKGAAAVWAGLPFNSMVELDGQLYAAGPGGLYLLTQEADDDGQQIDAEVAWDLLTMDSPQRKRFGGIYVAGQCLSPFSIRIASAAGTYTYKTSKPLSKGKSLQHRAEPGRGLDEVYYRVSLLQSKDFAVDRVVAEIENVARRI